MGRVMATIAFDTLKFANKLKSAGVLPEHAEAEAEALADIFEANLNEVATKEDIKLLKEDIKHLEGRFDGKFIQLEERFDGKFIQLEQRMTIKLGTLMVIAVGAVAALVKLL
jgi:hypothetical protein